MFFTRLVFKVLRILFYTDSAAVLITIALERARDISTISICHVHLILGESERKKGYTENNWHFYKIK